MSKILRGKLKWQSPVGGIGYSVFHFRDFDTDNPTNAHADGVVDRISGFLGGFLNLVPNNVTLSIPTDIEVIEDTTGQLTGFLTGKTLAPSKGGAAVTEKWAAAQGAVITWRTGGVRNGRRVRGRTFVVPLIGAAFDVDGTLSPATVTALTTAATTLNSDTASPDLGVYARPSAPGASDGAWYTVDSFSIPDVGAILRSRRD